MLHAATSDAVLTDALHELGALAPRIGMGLLVFAGFWVGSILVRSLSRRLGARVDYNTRFLLRLGSRIASIGLLMFGAVTALGTMGVNVSALVAGLGLTGFALGFALKDVLSNLMAGVLIIIYRPFRLNDYIAVKDHGEGAVIEIDLRYTTLEKEGQKYLVPNSVLFTNSIGLIEAKRRREVA
jgi:small conductance mechanosensitive channel